MFGISPFEAPKGSQLPKFEEAKKIAFENSLRTHEKNKILYDQNHKKLNLKERDLVYIMKGCGISRRKLEPIRIGSYLVIERLSDVSYKDELTSFMSKSLGLTNPRKKKIFKARGCKTGQ